MSTIQELEDELRRKRLEEHQQKLEAKIDKEKQWREENDIDVFTSDDYCGMHAGKYDFYFGYEVTVCAKHKVEDCEDRFDCDLREWAFTASVDGKEEMRVPCSKLYPTPSEEPFFHLLAGIGMYLKEATHDK